MKYLRAVAVVILAAYLAVFSGLAWARQAAEAVVVDDPYVRAVPPGQSNSASFMGLENSSTEDYALVGAESPAAKVVELHVHTMTDGMMRMRQVERVDLPHGAKVALQPGGYHLMLIGLQRDLVPGESIPLTLIFGDGSKRSLEVPVRKLMMQMHNTVQPEH